jgi:transcriptional regulator with XRE-family HTH domain
MPHQLETVVAETGVSVGRLVIERLMGGLSLSQDQLGRMLGVSGETVRRWKTGATGIPLSQVAELTAAESALDRLLRIFRPERLPLAIRRRAELFGGRRALDWILDGRIAEVADRYEAGLAYQG